MNQIPRLKVKGPVAVNQSAASVIGMELGYDSLRKAKLQCRVERVV